MTTQTRSLRATPRWLLALATALAACLIAATVVLCIPASSASIGGRADVETAAKQVAMDFTTYSYRHLPADIAHTSEDLDATFKGKYTKTMNQISPTLTKYEATSTGQILDLAVSSMTSKDAVVIAFLDQTITNSVSTKPQVDHLRMSLTLVKVGGKWLASSVDLK